MKCLALGLCNLCCFAKHFIYKTEHAGSENMDMTSEGLGEMFEGDFANMCADNFSLMSMGGRAEGLACTDPGVRTPISVSGHFSFPFLSTQINLHRGQAP
jgi:hypothetical protein